MVVGGLVLAALALVFALPDDLVLAAPDTDMVSEFVAWRAYLADSLRAGHVPLWNPYTYGGQPFLGGFESAVLYPPNLLFAVMPLGPALNFSILLHLVILGWGMRRWAAWRGLEPRAAALAGVIVPLSGAVFPHVYAGHLSNLCTMAWAPWIFLGLEKGARGGRGGWFMASAGVCLQILAGHAQYVFYTAIAAGLHAVVLALFGGGNAAARGRPLAGVAICYAAAALLGAAQLLPSLASSSESLRQQKLDYSFAAMFGFPPENFLTLIAPGFFGDLDVRVYWGRCYLWEMTLFVGTASLPLLAAALRNRARRRQAWLDLAVVLPLLALSLGAHTPVFDLLYAYAPGFGHFRSWSKFIFPATLFLVLAIAAGADAVLRGEKTDRRIGWAGVAGGVGIALGGIALFLFPETVAPWLRAIHATNESYLPPALSTRPDFISNAGVHAGLSLMLGGSVLTAAGAILLGPGKPAFFRWGVPALVVVEMLGFAAGQLSVAHFSDAAPTQIKQFVAAHPGDYRVLNLIGPNNGFLTGVGDVWGNNPTVLRRYAEFMTYSQGGDPDHATQYVPFAKLSPLYALVRLRYAFVSAADGFHVAESGTAPLPRALLIADGKEPGGRDAIFAALSDPAFDPRRTVLLESAPSPAPEPGATGTATVVSSQPDELTIEADTDKPAVLLVTDLYTRDWRVEALPGSAQQSYQLMPADYILRAVPLQAGHHRLRMFYAPGAFREGVAISALAWTVWAGFLVWRRKQERRQAG